jgi:hypothetical protein
MTIKELKNREATRVWINCPSHNLHGKVAIAIVDRWDNVRVYFTEGNLISMEIDPIYLERK